MSSNKQVRPAVTQSTPQRLRAVLSESLIFNNRTLLGVSLAVFAAFTGVGMVGPVRILYAQSQGASLAIIDAMASAYLISNFLFQYPVGWLADRWGRKQIIIIGLLVQALLSAVYLFVNDPILFVILRFVEGMAGAAILPPARALLIDIIPTERQGEAYGLFGAFFNAGFLLGPGIGGIVASWGYSTAFIGAVLFRLVAIAIVLLMVRTGARSTSVNAGVSQTRIAVKVDYRLLFTLPLIGAYILAFGDYLYLGFDMTLMPLWMHDSLGATVAVIGLAYVMWALPTTLLSPFSGRVADRRRRSTLILIFGLAQVPIYIAYGLLNVVWIILLFFIAHGIVYAFIQPAVDASVAAASVSGMRARVQGLYTTFGLLGAFIGASSFSSLYTLSFRYPLFVLGIGYGSCVLIGGLLIRRAERRALLSEDTPPAQDKVQPERQTEQQTA